MNCKNGFFLILLWTKEFCFGQRKIWIYQLNLVFCILFSPIFLEIVKTLWVILSLNCHSTHNNIFFLFQIQTNPVDSSRNELYGSWFIQTLCKKIDALSATQDLESIITEVKRDVAIDKQHEEYNKRTFEMNVNKQMPVMTSTLIRKLFLKKFGEKPSEEAHVDKLRRRSESRHEVLDAVSATPVTPLLVQFGPCSCFLDHFAYMRNCLRWVLIFFVCI